ncbi:MAG: hypothetical protein EOP11_22745 [Proteobacteria bacterium]|nr:MAG: hypothetical protein EOP11_22745 [Pseudomonadota bacterium]
MSNNKTFLWIAASMLTGAFCAATALAQPPAPDYYSSLSAEEGQTTFVTPAIAGGFYGLSGNERRYQEPLQLSGAVAKVKASKYSHRGASHGKYKKVSSKAKRAKPGKKAKYAKARSRTAKF